MKHWVLKAKKSYDYATKLRINYEEDWQSLEADGKLSEGDRVFLWISSPARRLTGLGEVIKPVGKYVRIRYLTRQFEQMPGIEFLKTVSGLEDASFLKVRHGTAFELSHDQAKELYRIVTKQNPGIHPWHDWTKGLEIDDTEADAISENRKLIPHLRRERNPQLAKKKKADFRHKHKGLLYCEACNSEHANYGRLTSDIFEVHHRLPLSKADGPVKSRLQDLAVLCPNCHRAIHRTDPMLTVAALAKRLGRNTPTK